MSATRSAAWAGMPAAPSNRPVSPRPRRSTARNRQPVSPPDWSFSTSARRASARPVSPCTRSAVFSESGSPQVTVLRSALACVNGDSSLRDGSRFFELASENRSCGAHTRYFKELLQGDTHLPVAAHLLGYAHVEGPRPPSSTVEGDGALVAGLDHPPHQHLVRDVVHSEPFSTIPKDRKS